MRISRGLLGVLLGMLMAGYASAAVAPTQEVLGALAPTGKLRVGLYRGSPVTVLRDDGPAEAKGVGLDLGRELARRLGVPFQPVIYPTPAAVMDGLKAGEWDVTVLARTPERAGQMNMTEPFLRIEHGFLVPPGSPITTIADVDRVGIRIGVPQGGSVTAALAQTIKRAAVIPIPGLAAAPDALSSGQVNVFAANKANLSAVSDKLPTGIG